MDAATQPFAVVYDAAGADWLYFENPRRVISVSELGEIMPALREIQALVEQRGWYAVGFVCYEAAPAFDSALMTRPAASGPLLWFGLFPEPRRTALRPQRESSDYRLGRWSASVKTHRYRQAIMRIKRHIARGQTYQVNYTFRLTSAFSGEPWPLFVEMLNGQEGGYPAYLDTGRQVICSASPELFFHLDGDRVSCRPMKGTAGRGRTLAEDQAQADALRSSEKNRAENVMIVDMLRNDLGRVAETGSVHVEELFRVERYRTLWQMTSTIKAVVKAPLAVLFSALFPCASITGAPRVSTMKIIAELEGTPRGAYTGSIGFLGPARQAQFNVAIRTLIIERAEGEDARPGNIVRAGSAGYGVGGGVVWDSSDKDEYAEARLKARIVTEPAPEFSLLETLRWTPEEGYFLLGAHLDRLYDSALYFGYPCERAELERHLGELAKGLPAAGRRIRLLLGRDGRLSHQSFTRVREETKPLHVTLAAKPVNSSDVFLFHKTTRREVYEQARAGRTGYDDVLLYNEYGELSESTIANLVVELDGRLFTPPVSCGLLAGTFRGALLKQGLIEERVIRRDELARCTSIFLVNSVREWMPVDLD